MAPDTNCCDHGRSQWKEWRDWVDLGFETARTTMGIGKKRGLGEDEFVRVSVIRQPSVQQYIRLIYCRHPSPLTWAEPLLLTCQTLHSWPEAKSIELAGYSNSRARSATLPRPFDTEPVPDTSLASYAHLGGTHFITHESDFYSEPDLQVSFWIFFQTLPFYFFIYLS
jgi:hypothetical protein